MGADRIILDEIVLEVMTRPAWIPAIEQHHLFQATAGHRQPGNDPGVEAELCKLPPHSCDHRGLVRHALDFVDEIKCRVARVKDFVAHQMPPVRMQSHATAFWLSRSTIASRRSASRRRKFGLVICPSARAILIPSGVLSASVMARRPSLALRELSIPSSFSKKNDTGTARILAASLRRLAPTRLLPFSYFCTCWKLTPSSCPNRSWDRPAASRAARMRSPT